MRSRAVFDERHANTVQPEPAPLMDMAENAPSSARKPRQRDPISMETFGKICDAARVSETARRRLLRLFRRNASRSTDCGAKLGLRTVTADQGESGDLQRVQSQAWNDGSQFCEEGRTIPKIRDVEPSLVAATMSLSEFVTTLAAFGIAEADAKRYFRVFDQQRTGSLDYREFVVGLVLMDKNTHHGGLLAEQRSLRIFQLYDEDNDGYLSRSELENLVAQVRSRRRDSVSRADVVTAAEEILRLANPAYASHVRGDAVAPSVSERVSQKQFLQAVGELKIRGTSLLFRLSCPILCTRRKTAAGSSGNKPAESHSDTVARSRSLAAAVPSDWARSTAGATSSSGAAVLSRASSDSQASEELVIGGLEIAHKVIAHLLLDDRYVPPPPRTAFTLLDGPDWLALINCAQNLVQKEKCCVNVPVPAKVFGDIHGQITELRALFSAFGSPNHRTGDINGFQYVFTGTHAASRPIAAPTADVWSHCCGAYSLPAHLNATGDFVDRGPHSLEVLSLLLSLKVAYPTSVFLIRGNHEDRALNEFCA